MILDESHAIKSGGSSASSKKSSGSWFSGIITEEEFDAEHYHEPTPEELARGKQAIVY